jgi:HlyD family secretion protein
MRGRKLIKIFLPIIILLLSVGVFKYQVASKPEKIKPVIKEKTWLVDTQIATQQTLNPEITLYGSVESPDLLNSAAPGNSVVKATLVRSGDRVKKGQRLIDLDSRDFSTELIEAQTQLDEVAHQIKTLDVRYQSNRNILQTERELLEIAEAEVRRMTKLKTQNLGTDSILNTAKSNLGKQRLAVLARQFEVDNYPLELDRLKSTKIRLNARKRDAQLKIERSIVKAPFEGIVKDVVVSAGDRVNNGQTLLTMIPLGSLEVRAHIPARYQTKIQQALADDVVISAKKTGELNSLRLQLTRLAGQAKPTGIDGYFKIADDSTEAISLTIGELVTLKVELPAISNVIQLPFQALYGNSRIYRLTDERLEGLNIETIGQKQDSSGNHHLLIRSDSLNEGDLIVTTHLPNAVTGLKVKTKIQ